MESIKLEALDLNLLLVFDALASERSVTQAAAKIGLSQPALSNALARMRTLFRDPLFERAGGRMEPTTCARHLLAPLNEVVAKLRETLETRAAFRPEVSEHEYLIATNDYLETQLLPPLVRRLRKQAPLAAVRTVRTEFLFVPPVDELQSNELHLALGFFGDTPRPQAGLLTKRISTERLVCILRAHHPRACRSLSLRVFAEIPHIRVLYPRREQFGSIDPILLSHGLSRRVAVTVPHYSVVPSIVAQSDLLGVVPEALARQVAGKFRLKIFIPPLDLSDVGIVMAWHERLQFDRAHRWLRDCVIATCLKLNAVSVATPHLPANAKARKPRRE